MVEDDRRAIGIGAMTGTHRGAEPRWLTEPEQQAWRAYLRGSRMLMEAMDKDLAPYGMSLSEYEIVSMLSEQPERQLRMSELAAIIVQSRSRLTHTATRLEQRGWVTRRPYPGDKRGVLLTLTDEGFAKVVETAPVHLSTVRRFLIDQLSPAEFVALGTAMAQVRRGLVGYVADVGPPGPGGLRDWQA